MEKQFKIKSVKALKNVKALATKYEKASKLDFSALAICCEAGPIIDRATAVFSL